MLKDFADKDTAALWAGKRCRLPADIRARAAAKLQQLHAAPNLDFMRQPPGNRLEALQGDRAGRHSVRINDQWRICFFWDGADAYKR
jgi:proteic killer suppression protein